MILSSGAFVSGLVLSPTLQNETTPEAESFNLRELVYNISQANKKSGNLAVVKTVLIGFLSFPQSNESTLNPFYFKHSIYVRFCTFLL